MGKLKVILIIALAILLTSCKSKPLKAYTILEERVDKDSHICVITDGDYIYDYDVINNDIISKRLNTYSLSEPAIYLVTWDNYTLSYLRPITYYGDYFSLCGYVSYLYSLGYTCEELYANSNYYDIILTDSEYRIRIIYQNSTEIKILCENVSKTVCSPPYISGRKENYETK